MLQHIYTWDYRIYIQICQIYNWLQQLIFVEKSANVLTEYILFFLVKREVRLRDKDKRERKWETFFLITEEKGKLSSESEILQNLLRKHNFQLWVQHFPFTIFFFLSYFFLFDGLPCSFSSFLVFYPSQNQLMTTFTFCIQMQIFQVLSLGWGRGEQF